MRNPGIGRRGLADGLLQALVREHGFAADLDYISPAGIVCRMPRLRNGSAVRVTGDWQPRLRMVDLAVRIGAVSVDWRRVEHLALSGVEA